MASRALPDLIARIRLDSSGVDEAVGSLTKSFSRTNVEMAGVVAGIAGIAAITRSFIDLAGKNDDAQANLAQAYKSQGLNLAINQDHINDYLNLNRKFIDDQYAAKDAIANFTRAGFSQDAVFRLMNDSLDLAAVKHISLADAAKTLLLAEEGNTRGLRDLGITSAEVSAIFKEAPNALKDVAKAQDHVTAASEKLASAQDALDHYELVLHAKKKVSLADLDTEREKKEAVVKASQGLKTANDALATAQNGVVVSGDAQSKLLDKLEPKIRDGHLGVSKLKQSQNELAASWDHLANDAGPPLIDTLRALTSWSAGFLDALGDSRKWAGISTFLANLAVQIQAAIGAIPRSQQGGNRGMSPGGLVPENPSGPYGTHHDIYGRSMASGGIVSGLPGMPQTIIAHGGEAVIRGDQLDQVMGYLAVIAKNTSQGPSFSTTAYGRS